MKKYFYFSILVALSGFSRLQAQDLTMNYLSYVYNLYNINPAYCAIGHKFSGIIDVKQRSGLDAKNAMIGLSGQLNARQGIGLRLNSDNRGPFQVMVLDVTYGYKVELSKVSNLYFGLSAGFNDKSLNTSKIKNYSDLDQTDPTLNVSNFRSTTLTAGAGLIYEYKTLELALSAPQMLSANQKSLNYITFMAANIFHVNDKLEVIPMLFYFNTPVVKNLASLQTKMDYGHKFWLQLGAQSNSLFNIGAGIHYKELGIGYGYTTSNKLTNRHTSGSHEIILTLKIGQRRAPYLEKHGAEEHVE